MIRINSNRFFFLLCLRMGSVLVAEEDGIINVGGGGVGEQDSPCALSTKDKKRQKQKKLVVL